MNELKQKERVENLTKDKEKGGILKNKLARVASGMKVGAGILIRRCTFVFATFSRRHTSLTRI